jgi:uncharacterized membrane protein
MIILAGLVAALVLGFAAYRIALDRVAVRLMDGAEKRLLEIRDSGPNSFRHGRAPTHESQRIVMPSPDLVYSSCVYDLAAGDLVIAGDLPPAGHYWSLSLYAHNTDNYFVLNDRELPARRFSITLSRKARPGVVRSPTRTGIALIRMIQRRDDDLPVIRAAQQSVTCGVTRT